MSIRPPFQRTAPVTLLLAGLAAGGGASAATLEIEVTNLRNGQGQVLAAVCPLEQFLRPGCPYHGRAQARSGTVIVRIEGLPAGTWAVQVFHDENLNEDIDRTWYGIPLEGIGFSNNAPFRYGPPRFEDAAITVGKDGARITLAVRYF
jgi:uncharacterized protein (DUF2141 family)